MSCQVFFSALVDQVEVWVAKHFSEKVSIGGCPQPEQELSQYLLIQTSKYYKLEYYITFLSSSRVLTNLKKFFYLEKLQIQILKPMNSYQKQRMVARSEQLNINLEVLFNNVALADFSFPFCLPSHIEKQGQENKERSSEYQLVKGLGKAPTFINIMRILKMKRKVEPIYSYKSVRQITTLSSLIFCRPVKKHQKDEKIYWIVQNKQKKKLNLDNPKCVLIMPERTMVTIQRKYINVYQIQENLQVSLKDFDSDGLGKKFEFVDIKYIREQNKDFILIFGNQKCHLKFSFLVLVFELKKNKIFFIKKAIIAERQVLAPAIIFQNDQGATEAQRYCMVLGGCSQNYENVHYWGLWISLHILLSQFLNYGVENTRIIPFSNKKTITMGKSIYFKDTWYCLCSQSQTINEIKLHSQGKQLKGINIRSESLNLKQKIFVSEDSIHYLYENEQDKLVFLDKNLQFKQKLLSDILIKFST